MALTPMGEDRELQNLHQKLHAKMREPIAPSRTTGVIVSIAFIAVGVVMVTVSVLWLRSERAFLARAMRAPGVVIDLVFYKDSPKPGPSPKPGSSPQSPPQLGGAYHAVVTFTTASGERITFEDREGRNPPAYAEGEQVAVLYDPSNPQKIEIEKRFPYFFQLLLLLMGMGFTGIPLAYLCLEMREPRTPSAGGGETGSSPTGIVG